LKVLERKPIREIDDETSILAGVSEKATRQVKATGVGIKIDRGSKTSGVSAGIKNSRGGIG
jgi:hypothetical protein